MNKCNNCQKEIDKRSKQCSKCRSLFNNPFKGKKHSEQTKKIIGEKSSKKFTDDFLEKNYRSKNKNNKKRSINGYVLIKNYTHPNRNSHNDILEHILVMSNAINRPLNKGEVVHHINGEKTDNRIENLYLCSSRKEHMKIHRSLNSLAKQLLDLQIIYFKEGNYFLTKNE